MLIATSMLTYNTSARPGQPAANLDQIRNGPANSPWDPANWVNGNAGPQNAHYYEGGSIRYRCCCYRRWSKRG